MSQYIHAFDASNKRVKPVAVDTDGHLQVDVVSMTGGGDATAANQVTNHGKLDSVITKLGEIDTVLDAINNSSGAAGNLEGIRQALLSDVQGKLDHISDDIDGVDATLGTTNSKLDTLDGSVNTIEACVSANELAVSHGALTELAAALNSSKLDVNIASDGASLATSANQSTTNTHLNDIKGTHYQDGDAIAASDKGQLVMGRDNSNNAHPLHITANGDLEVEIADFVKGQATKENSFPVTLATNQPSIAVNDDALAPSYSQSTLESATLITSGSNTSEINMNGYRHLTIFGSSSVNFGSLCLVRRATSGGTDFLDGSNMISANDPTGGSNYHFGATFENVGNQYLAFRNVDASSQTVTLYAVLSR